VAFFFAFFFVAFFFVAFFFAFFLVAFFFVAFFFATFFFAAFFFAFFFGAFLVAILKLSLILYCRLLLFTNLHRQTARCTLVLSYIRVVFSSQECNRHLTRQAIVFGQIPNSGPTFVVQQNENGTSQEVKSRWILSLHFLRAHDTGAETTL
jgi:hypothetical protein